VIIAAGALGIIVAFCWDFRHIMEGGIPTYFNWPLFCLGECAGFVAFLRGYSRSGRQPASHRALQSCVSV
jgi:hypothetical protein